ncbi:hypothetical protein PF006_g23482 [Phytophthora fragariae]|uniref:Uncharacterized protein n=1 Tax=Phytophthora fragariae TaxID=53985 RepID=A0A6A3RPQ9_9STRA|nr:hypothetical protein PF006_g23482 [Phytophthora fragariae]
MGNCFRRGERARREFNDAVILGDLKRVRRLIRYAKEGGEEGERGHLWWAAYLGHLEVVRYFVEQCVSGVDVSDASQDSAFLEAATWGHVAVVRYLTERRDANLNVSNALREAAGRGHLDVVKYLTERCDANLNVTDALLEAAGCGQVDIVQYLAERCDADVNAEDDFGYTALMKATYRGNVRLVRYLVEQCAVDVSAMTLTEAARKGRLNVVRYLVEQCGVDVNKEDKYGQTAVTAAVTAGEIEVVRHLVADCTVHVNSAAVRLAAECGYIDIQRILTPFLLAEPGETTKDGGDFVLSPGIPARCFIPPSEIELTLFHENGSIGGDFLAKWLDSDVAVKLFIPDAFSTSFEDEWRIQSLMASLGEMGEAATEAEGRWQQQRNEQIKQFISGVSDTFLLLNALKTVKERSAFLIKLKEDMETTGKYTPDQLEVMEKVYDDLASKLEGDDWSELAPVWFIPLYELVIDEWNKLGEGSFGSVHRAKWLDSDVVVKRVILVGSTGTVNASTSYSIFSASEDPSATQVQEDTAKRAEARAMFRREVDIWFGFSHPHVVRLFADRAAMKYHATRGKLPGRPSICEDSEWELVERMCVLEPAKRIKISTVIDELEKLTGDVEWGK